MKFAVVGNCQARGIHRAMQALAPQHEFKIFHLSRIMRADPVLDQVEQWAEEVASSDVAFIVNHLPAKAGPFAEENIVPRCRSVVRFPYLAFTGFHPDCIYLRSNGKDVPSPVGPYHSAIVYAAWAVGIPEKHVPALFNRFTFNSLKLPLVHGASIKKLSAEWSALGFDYSTFFDSNRSFMHTVNHPKIEILADTARQALEQVGIATPPLDQIEVEDELAKIAVWPVYYDLLSDFEQPSNTFGVDDRTLSMDEFISGSFQQYDFLKGTELLGHGVEPAKAFFRDNYAFTSF